MPQPSLLVIDSAGNEKSVFTLNPNGQAVAAESQPMVLPGEQVEALIAGRASEQTLAAVAAHTAKAAANSLGKATEVTQLAIKAAIEAQAAAVSTAATAAAAHGAKAATEDTLTRVAAGVAKVAANGAVMATEATLVSIAAAAAASAHNSGRHASEATLLSAVSVLEALGESAEAAAVVNGRNATEASLRALTQAVEKAAAASAGAATELTLAGIAASSAAVAANGVGKATESTQRAAKQTLDDIAGLLNELAAHLKGTSSDVALADIASSTAVAATNSGLAATEATLSAVKAALTALAANSAKAAANSARAATETTLTDLVAQVANVVANTAPAATETTLGRVQRAVDAIESHAASIAATNALISSESTSADIAAAAAATAANTARGATEGTLQDVKRAIEALRTTATGSPSATACLASGAIGAPTEEAMSVQGASNGTPVDSRLTSSPEARSLGLVATLSGYGHLRVTTEPGSLFSDPLAGASLDVTHCWNIPANTGDMAIRQAGGALVATGTSTNAASAFVDSQPAFAPPATGHLDFGCSVKLESRVAGLFALNQHRFWGFGDRPYVFSSEAPLHNAVGFEIGANGQLSCVVYVDGVNKFRATADLQKSALNALVSAHGSTRFELVVRSDAVLFYVGTLEYPVQAFMASAADFSPMCTLPVRIAAVNGASGSVGRSALQVSAIGVGDTAANGKQISDGTHPWRKAAVDTRGRLAVASTPMAEPSYHYGQSGLAPTSATNLVALEAGRTKSATLKRIHIVSGTAASASVVSIAVVREVAPGESGAVSVCSAMNRDVRNPNFSGTVRSSGFDAGATTATGMAFDIPTPKTGSLPQVLVFDLTNGGTLEGLVIPAGISNGLALVHPGVSGAAGFGVRLEWVEGEGSR